MADSPLFDREKLQARFHALTAKREAIRAKADPIREQRDKIIARHAKEAAEINKKVQAAEKGLFEIDQERAMIARALGNVGEPK